MTLELFLLRAVIVVGATATLAPPVDAAQRTNQSEYRAATMTKRPNGYEFSVNSGRPVFEILQLLSDRTGVVINYEDPPLWFSGELDDITAEISVDPKAAELRGGRQVRVPRNKAMTWQDRLESHAPSLGQVRAAVVNLVNDQNARDDGGKFKVVRDGNVLHVVPARTRTRDGRWWNVMSLMDVRVSVPAHPRTAREQVRAVLDAARDQSRLTFVGMPYFPEHALAAPAKTYVVENITAREALMNVLSDFEQPTRWAALFDPLTEGYYVSFFAVSDELTRSTEDVDLNFPASPPAPGPASAMPPPK